MKSPLIGGLHPVYDPMDAAHNAYMRGEIDVDEFEGYVWKILHDEQTPFTPLFHAHKLDMVMRG
jgi:hypothetical protein